MNRSFLAAAVLALAYALSGCAAVKQQAKDYGAELKEAGVAFYRDVKEEVKKEVAARLPELEQAALDIVTKALEKQAAELKAKELAKLDAQLALFPTTTTDELTGVETTVVKTWKDFDADGDGDLNEKEVAALGKEHGVALALAVAKGEISSGQAAQHATGTGLSIAAILGIMMAKKGGRQALANLLKTGGSATAGVAG